MKLQLVFDEKLRGNGGIGAARQIAQILHQQGVESSSILYDEALELARTGDFVSSAERLRMLLCLHPNDGHSRILLAKILAAQKLWQQAMAMVDSAAESGVLAPESVRNFIEQGLQREIHLNERERKKALNRDRSEIQQLKKQLKRLRSENSGLNNENSMLAQLARRYSSACGIVSGASICALAFLIMKGPSEPVPETPPQAEAPSQDISLKEGKVTVGETRPASSIPEPPAPPPPPPEPEIVEEEPEPVPEPPRKPRARNGQELPTEYTVKPGDTLDKIAERFYGRKSYWRVIAEHNDVDPRKLMPRQKLEIPPLP